MQTLSLMKAALPFSLQNSSIINLCNVMLYQKKKKKLFDVN